MCLFALILVNVIVAFSQDWKHLDVYVNILSTGLLNIRHVIIKLYFVMTYSTHLHECSCTYIYMYIYIYMYVNIQVK